ncbi:MAG: Protein-disulfide oxidoreductase DsbI [Syntrophus sp. PtaU1.Bin208]|nr:MAG: Protein-disulfide oxidoreductase DsbI [Syntrophus sp. PtaU1.Bin208]
MTKWIEKIAALQDSRGPWILLAGIGLGLELAAYSIFQKWLFMRPCELCVYMRFAMACLVIGGLVGAIHPKILVLKLAAYGVAVYGAAKGILDSLTLIRIGRAYRSDDPFGVEGCSTIPTFPFHLPLHEWFPGVFLPTGECGIDYPIVPPGAVLSPLQKYFTDLYRDGWHLIPSCHFMDMGQSMLLFFSLILLVLLICLVCRIIVEVKQ